MKPVLSWPPKADELQSDAALVPDMLYNMLAWILTSDTEFSTERVTNLPNHVHRWILSLGQDLIHCVSRDRQILAHLKLFDDASEIFRIHVQKRWRDDAYWMTFIH